MNLEDIRRDYNVGSLSHSDMTEDPLDKCREWLEDALRLKVIEPTALIVSTATPVSYTHLTLPTILLV